MAGVDIFLTIFDLIFGLAIIFFTIVIFSPINKYRRIKVKEDQLFLQKTLITTIYFCLFLIFNIITFFSDDLKKYIFLSSTFIFNAYVILMLSYNLLMTLEMYRTYKNPVHYFNRLFRQYKNNYLEELILLIVCIITIGVDVVISLSNNNLINNDSDEIYICYLYLINYWKPFVIIILVIVYIIFYCKIRSLIRRFYFNNQQKLLNAISKRRMNYFLYLIYAIFSLFPFITKFITDEPLSNTYKVFATVFFFIVIIDDFMIHISEIASSKFCEYALKRTFIGSFCACFYKPNKYMNGSKTPLVSGSSDSSLTNDILVNVDLATNNIFDKELIKMYKNGIFIEDYFLNYFDQILNIVTSSLNQIYNSKHFSTQANEKSLTDKLKIEDISGIGGNVKDTSVSTLGTKTVVNTKNEVGEDTVKFYLKKNMENDDLKKFRDVLENRLMIKNNNNFLNITINSFMTPKCVESIYDQKIKGRNIGASLLSHMILSNVAKNRNPENPAANFWSLLASNGKEQYFNKLKNTSIKTYDKNFTLDIFDTDDNEINVFEKGTNNSLAQLLDKYFTYIHGKGINGTFIPSLVGVFKIKINDFKTLLVLVTRNSLVENVPKSHFSYWQLLRILKGRPQKVSSSQFNSSNSFVKDDPIFERPFQIESIKDNPNYNKIAVKNYNDFESIINSDIEFLRQVGAKNFGLLLMYYQFENTQKHEKQGAIKIKQTNKGAELVEESLPKGFLEEDIGTPIEKGNKGSFDGDFLSLGAGGFFDDENFGGDFNMKKVMNTLDNSDKSNMNGFEGIFDNFNCLCYFTFENVFDIRKRNEVTEGYYNNFRQNILNYFAEYKK